MKIHIAGFPVKVGPLRRQLCAWCGEALIDEDDRNTMVAPNADGSPGSGFGWWETGALVKVDGPMSAVVPHEDGAKLPPEACAPKAPPPGCPNCCADCLNATGGQCRAHQEPECTCYELHGAGGGHQPGCPMYRTH